MQRNTGTWNRLPDVRVVLAGVVVLAVACATGEDVASPTEPAPATDVSSPSPARDDDPLPTPPPSAERARVVRVVDGDTVVLSGIDVGTVDRSTGGRRARLIGVDTPEVHGATECFGRQASAFVEDALGGAEVLVDLDVQATDRFGRALVYLWHEGGFFNARLVAEGYALQLTIPPNVRYAELFTALARQAREDERGLWAACQTAPS